MSDVLSGQIPVEVLEKIGDNAIMQLIKQQLGALKMQLDSQRLMVLQQKGTIDQLQSDKKQLQEELAAIKNAAPQIEASALRPLHALPDPATDAEPAEGAIDAPKPQ